MYVVIVYEFVVSELYLWMERYYFPHTMHDLDIFPLESLILDNCVIIDKSKHWPLLLFKESLHIQRQKPELNHGSKASKELCIFN